MARGIKKKIEEPEEMEEPEEIQEEVEEQVQHIKTKKVMSEKQLEALRKGRELGKLKLKEHAQKKHVEHVEKVKVETAVKQAKQETKTRCIEDLKKVADTYELRKKIDTIDEKLSSYLEEKKERRKMKETSSIDKSVKTQLPRAVNEAMMKQKLQNEYNPFIGLV